MSEYEDCQSCRGRNPVGLPHDGYDCIQALLIRVAELEKDQKKAIAYDLLAECQHDPVCSRCPSCALSALRDKYEVAFETTMAAVYESAHYRRIAEARAA